MALTPCGRHSSSLLGQIARARVWCGRPSRTSRPQRIATVQGGLTPARSLLEPNSRGRVIARRCGRVAAKIPGSASPFKLPVLSSGKQSRRFRWDRGSRVPHVRAHAVGIRTVTRSIMDVSARVRKRSFPANARHGAISGLPAEPSGVPLWLNPHKCCAHSPGYCRAQHLNDYQTQAPNYEQGE